MRAAGFQRPQPPVGAPVQGDRPPPEPHLHHLAAPDPVGVLDGIPSVKARRADLLMGASRLGNGGR